MNVDVDPTPSTSANDRASNPHASAESLQNAASYLAEVREYALHYLAAKLAIAKLNGRRIAIIVGIAAVGFLVVGAMLVSATVLLLLGASNAIGTAFNPPKPWIGQMTIGLVFIGGTLLATWLVLRKATNTSRRKTIETFEHRRREQKQRVGHDVVERATMSEVES